MGRSKAPAPKADLSRLYMDQPWKAPAAEADATRLPTERRAAERRHSASNFPGTERRVAERRRYGSDFRHRESRLRAAAQFGGIGVYDFDFATGTCYCSPELKALAGLPEDAGDMNLEQLARGVHPEDRERFSRQVEVSLDSGGNGQLEGEFRLVRPDGTLRWIAVRGRTFFAGGSPERWVLGASGLVIDITGQRRAEEALRASEEKFQALTQFANMTEAFAQGEPIFDARGKPVDYRFLEANDAFYLQSGIPRGNLGRPVKEYIPVVEQFWVDTYAEVATTGRAIRFENYNAGTRRHYDVIAFSPSPGRFAILFRDVTEQRNSEEDLKKFKFFSDHSNDGHLVGDSEGRIRYVNRRLCERLGYSKEELLRLRLQDIAPTFTTAFFWELVERTQKGGMPPFESIRRRKDGSVFPVEVSATGLKVKGEWLIYMVSRDITERKHVEEALKESERRLAMALEASASAVWEMDVATGTVRGDDRLFTGLGYAPGELPTRADWKALIHEKEQAAATEQLDDVIEGRRERCRIEVRFQAKNGDWHWWDVHATAAERDEAGRALRLVGTYADITDRKANEAQIQALNAELESRVMERTAQLQESNEALLQSNTELKHFAHATAHDLQTPLRSIAGFTQLLQQEMHGHGNKRVDEWSAAIVDNTRRLQMLIQEVLSYTRLDAQGLPFQMTDLGRLLGEVVASLSVLISESGAEVTGSALPALPVDRTQIAQVLQNLIENGIKYNRSTPPRVAVSAELQDCQWVFSVADNGVGIDPKHHDRIFELFQRLHAYHQIPGTGIGLALCRRIVERHGGHIWVDSRPGEGSTFYFSLPAERSEAP